MVYLKEVTLIVDGNHNETQLAIGKVVEAVKTLGLGEYKQIDLHLIPNTDLNVVRGGDKLVIEFVPKENNGSNPGAASNGGTKEPQ